MKNMWKSNKITSESLQSPKVILDEQCIMLSRITDDKVYGVVKEYNGNYRSYEYNPPIAGVAASASKIQKKFDVQTKLGNQSEDGKFVYEFYLASQALPKYKYRVFFLAFGADFYPVEISLDETIATEIGIGEEFDAKTIDEYREVLEKILGSERITNIIKNLYSVY